MLTTVYLYGELGQKFPRKHKLAAATPAEALRGIDANYPGFAAYLIAAGDRGVAFKVKVDGEAIPGERLNFQRPGAVIRISPVVAGRKDKTTSIILGVALVALTWGAGAGFLGVGAKAFVGGAMLGIKGLTVGAFIGGMGLSMAVGGIAQMLSPTSRGPELSDGKPSYIFNGPVNTTEQGGPVPLCYGMCLIGSRIASAGIYSEDIGAAIAAPSGTNDGEGSFTTDPDYPTTAGVQTASNLRARSLQTRQIARHLHLLSEGEVEGICDADWNVLDYENRNKGILFNLTPVQNADGTTAYKEFATAFRPGLASQSYMAGFPSAESETSVEEQVIKAGDKWANSVQRTIAAGSHNAVRVTVRFPALYEIDAKGNRTGSAVHFGIQLKRSAEVDWREVVGGNLMPNGELDGLIQGEALQPYVRSFRIPLYGVGPWDLRVGRESADSPDPAKIQNDLYWQSYTLITDEKLTYRNSAMLAVEISAERFSTQPTVATRLKGIKVRVPSNYNPATRNYTGAWDGKFAGADLTLTAGYTAGGGTLTVSALAAALPLNSPIEITSGSTTLKAFLLAAASAGATSLSITPINANISNGATGYGYHLKWTNNPAWVGWDIKTHNRYGLGSYITDANLDKYAFYSIAQYCDAVDGSGNYVGVDTGRGDSSVEPRFTFNYYIQSTVEAYRLLSDLASCYRGMIYWGSGFITAVQDCPKDPKFNFTDANVIDGAFNFSDTAAKARHTVCYVQWNDPDDNFAAKFEEVTDDDGVEELGVRPTTIVAVGCTSRGEARRKGRWLIFTERLEFETGTFRTAMEGARCRPGDIARCSVRFKTTNRMYGRVVAAGAGTITLDAPAVIGAGTWTLFVAKQDGTDVELTVTDPAGTYSTLNVTGSLTGIVPNAVFILRSSTIEPMLFRILNAKEIEPRRFEIIALRYIPEKFAAVESGLLINLPPTSDFPTTAKPEPATSLAVSERGVDTASGTQRFLTLTWAGSASNFVKSYVVEYRAPNGEWEELDAAALGLSSSPKMVTELGDHSFRVYARSMMGVLSDAATVNYTLAEVTDPTVPTNLVATAQAEGIFLQWDNPDEPDLTVVEVQESLNTTFTDPPVAPSPIIGTAPAEAATKGSFARGAITSNYTRYFRIRVRNKSGGKSAWTAYVSATATIPPTGPIGPGLVSMGDYNGATVYYHNSTRKDVVKYGGSFYIVNNAAKSGTATWGTPGGGDWDGPYSSYKFVATALLLAEDATITKTLVMGDGATGNGGIIRSVAATAYGTGAGFWMNPRNGSNLTEFRVGDPAGSRLAFNGSTLVARADTFLSGMEVESGDTSPFQVKGPISIYDFHGGGGFGSTNITTKVAGGTQSAKSAALAGSNFGMTGNAWDGGAFSAYGRMSITLANAASTNLASDFALYTKNTSNQNQYLQYNRDGKLTITNTGSVASLTSGRFNIENAGTSAAGGIYFDTDTNLYRSAANRLKTDDSFECTGEFRTDGDIKLGLTTERWIYDNSGNRILRARYGFSAPADASDLTTAIDLANWCKAVALHHGLGA